LYRTLKSGANKPAVDILHDLDLLAALLSLQELEYIHCDTKTTPLRNIEKLVRAFSDLVKLTVEVQINKFHR
jgi:hypothetical protein